MSSQPPNYLPQGPPQGPPPGYGQQPFQVPPPQPLPKQKRSKKWLLPAVGAFLLGTIIGCAGGQGGGATSAVPAAGPTVTVTAPGKTVTQAAGKAAPAPTVTITGKAEPAPTVTVTEKAPEPEPTSDEDDSAQDDSTISDGTYLVGDEIATGNYKSGEPDGLCYADTQNEDGDILSQEVSDKGPVIIRITKKAYTFTARNCGDWKKVG